MMRFLQYFCAFLMPTLTNMQGKDKKWEDIIARLGLLRGNMSMTRKIMRFGGEISIILKVIQRFKDN